MVRISEPRKAKALSLSNDTDTFVYIVDDDPVHARIGCRAGSVTGHADQGVFLRGGISVGCARGPLRLPGIGRAHDRNGRTGFAGGVRRRDIPLPVIVITGYADVPVAVRAMQAGAVSFLTKPCQPDDLWATIQQALERCRAARDVRVRNRTIEQRLGTLTGEERAVLAKVLLGTPNKLIVRDLDIGLRTVELRRSNMMKKMARNRSPN